MNKKFLISGLIGGILFLFLGLAWGKLFGSMIEKNVMAGFYKPMEECSWLFQIIGNLAWGFLMTYILTISNTSGFGRGATVGAVIGILIASAFDFEMYGISYLYTSLPWIFVDLLANIVLFGVSGGIIAAYLGMGKK